MKINVLETSQVPDLPGGCRGGKSLPNLTDKCFRSWPCYRLGKHITNTNKNETPRRQAEQNTTRPQSKASKQRKAKQRPLSTPASWVRNINVNLSTCQALPKWEHNHWHANSNYQHANTIAHDLYSTHCEYIHRQHRSKHSHDMKTVAVSFVPKREVSFDWYQAAHLCPCLCKDVTAPLDIQQQQATNMPSHNCAPPQCTHRVGKTKRLCLCQHAHTVVNEGKHS